ncbi:thiol:disulfide interchange protein DsbA/DsbL [Pseudoalteromonas sp. MMG013]|uniref:Thiol:disulfide interchange protein n=1 Tax=Pseudoalteromonas aurantia 208 TaxID=1314867 RepID=A0ABR9EGC4_9GAMM|nr:MULTISPECIES: thiol:disulfide interchange protein DsbA/DsbL [Pseudoalteromonas]MBE0369782.1 thiol:disulfide interchange protein DsbA [Pseudoalteromonas aurantia 208]MBQ4844747.1 thiol:disulfide interchange protein DsbA/DsbL [Pseudoalteromonas sp. MMG005]MBQ4852223.1 thiol:disulfide interchange protein DsbA/DsbL [Pseudoalteromonas sp. MMG012]MBQ4862038.1 thiol:disulfide interchange protein DsbA/DsbL [Pseudoalteromonas sp. MMG013]
MLKKLQFAVLLFCLPLFVMAADFTDGKHYQTLTTEKSASPKVTEFFSFYCPHCFRFEPVAKALADNLPKGAVFEKSHVNFLGGLSADVQSNLSYAYIVAKNAGKGDDIAAKLFDSIHVKKVPLDNITDLKKLLEVNGITGAQFDAALATMPVISEEKAMQDAQEKFSKAGALTGVPTFIVNDKYKINVSELQSQDELNDLVKHLLKK